MKAEEIQEAMDALPATPQKALEEGPKRTADSLPRLVLKDAVRSATDEGKRLAERDVARAKRLLRIATERRAIDPRIAPRLLSALRRTRTPCALLLGPTGTGKTSAMHWIRAEFGGAIVHARDLGSSERRHGLGEGYPPELRAARTERMLYIDDIGAEDPRDLSALQYALDCRYRDGLATVATSGLTEAELTRHLGAPYVRRLTDQHVTHGENEWPVLLVDLFGG